VIDVENKDEMVLLAEIPYETAAYTHQGWVTGNHEYVLLNDEMDETNFNLTQQSLIFSVRNLTQPFLVSIYDSNLTVVDHNEYIIDLNRSGDGYKGFVFQSNYEAGVRILNIDHIADGVLEEVAYFDNYVWRDGDNYTFSSDDHNNPNYRGSWSVYPYFKPHRDGDQYSEVIVVQNINTGLYVLRHDIGLNDIFRQNGEQSSGFWTESNIIIVGTVSVAVLLIMVIVVILLRVYKRQDMGDKQALIENSRQMTATSISDGDTHAE